MDIDVLPVSPADDLVSISASADEHGMVRGELSAPSPEQIPARVKVVCNGAWSATVPVTARPAEEGAKGAFSCRLPPVAEACENTVEFVEPESGTLLARIEEVARQPLFNSFGLSADKVLTCCHTAMFGVPWISFDGARITVSGCHLPPGGDPSRLSVELAPGVRYKFACAQESHEFGSNFWYYPNSHLSGFILTIDLVGSERDSDPFYFDFVYAQGDTPEPAAETISPRNPRLRQRIWIPKDFRTFIGYPQDGTQLTRVQTWSDAHSVSFTGYNVFSLIQEVLGAYGIRPDSSASILDWGCGHGRVTRHFIDRWPSAKIFGADIDAENIAWCEKHLARGTFHAVPLLPPTKMEAGSLDAVFGISVMTHLTKSAQHAWLMELRRLLKPGGLALLTFGANGAAAYGSYWRKPEWWARWLEEGFDDDLHDPALAGKIGDDTYYRITTQSNEWTRAEWSKFFDIVAIENNFVGNQNMAVLRRR